jgi:hypothetical protein
MLVKVFIQKRQFSAIFHSKGKIFHLFVVVFLCILDGWESHMTARQPLGGGRGEGALTGTLPFFLLIAWESLLPVTWLCTFL